MAFKYLGLTPESAAKKAEAEVSAVSRLIANIGGIMSRSRHLPTITMARKYGLILLESRHNLNALRKYRDKKLRASAYRTISELAVMVVEEIPVVVLAKEPKA